MKNNILHLQNLIDASAEKAGRQKGDVKLVAVSKTKPLEDILEAYECGIRDFGENSAQEAKFKSENIQHKDINWHFIGRLQTNKVKYVIGFCSLLHSLDRGSLAAELHKKLIARNKTLDCLVQINTSGEESKAGIAPAEAENFVREVAEKYPSLRIKGLMTIAENSNDLNVVRANFKQLKNIFEELKTKKIEGVEMKELSMGMSGDFEIAIDEGATIVRVGSAIFGERSYATEEKPKNPSFSDKVEASIYKLTPTPVKRFALRVVDLLPAKMANWIKTNKFLSICIAYSIRGLFLRPSMWAVYAAIAAYFGFK